MNRFIIQIVKKDDRNIIERVILDGFSKAEESTVIVRVTSSNLGFGVVQKYSLASNECLENGKHK